MRNLFCYLSAFLYFTASSMASAKSAHQQQFEALLKSPKRIVTMHDQEALIVERGEDSYQAIFVTVEDARKKRICSYGVDFLNDVSILSGTYPLKTSYFCQDRDQFKPYDGTFYVVIFRKCSLDFCPIGGAGVGNLLIKSDKPLNTASLPLTLDTLFNPF